MKGDHLLMFSRKIRKKCVAENMMVKMIKTFPPQNAQHRSKPHHPLYQSKSS